MPDVSRLAVIFTGPKSFAPTCYVRRTDALPTSSLGDERRDAETVTMFQQAFEIVLGHEGDFDRTVADPGNWTGGRVGSGELRGTKYGISAAAYSSLDIGHLTLEEAKAIYQRDYWSRIDADLIPPALALLVFDAAVNSGVRRAVIWLQKTVGATEDGEIGDQTVAATNNCVAENGLAAVCAEFMAQRLVFMAELPTWYIFGLGWARRLAMLPFEAAALAAPATEAMEPDVP